MGISLRQFEQMKDRVAGRPARGISPPVSPETRAVSSIAQVILGIDPSLRGTGYGVIRAERSGPVALAQGTIGLLNDRDRAKAMGCEAVKLYREVFDLEHTIAALRGA